jgi:hypothetical protein
MLGGQLARSGACSSAPLLDVRQICRVPDAVGMLPASPNL